MYHEQKKSGKCSRAQLESFAHGLALDNEDVVLRCREIIMNESADIIRQGKNWYVTYDGCEITINAKSYTIITAHKTNG